MLDQLDAVDWASLTHAYGQATDVPNLLRALLSPDAKRRDEAEYELFGNIWHQGTVYPATAAAVPFLYELLADPTVPGRSMIAVLIATIADGNGSHTVQGADEERAERGRQTLAKRGRILEVELVREREMLASVRRAVAAGLEHLIPFLRDDPEAEVRRYVAIALGLYPERAADTLPALEAAAETESDPDAKAAIDDSLARLGTAFGEPR